MARCLITGGAGFIGSHLSEALIARGDEVAVIDDLSTGTDENLRALVGHPRFQFYRGSINDSTLLFGLLDWSDEVYHLAAAVGVKLVVDQPVRTIETNIHPSQMLLSRLAGREARRRRVFLASTSEVYGKSPRDRLREDDDMVLGPTSKARWAYGCSKAIDEFLALAYCHEFGLPVVVGRFFNVVGPRQVGNYGMVLPRFVEQALGGGPVVVYDDGQQVRCFAHVDDVVRAVIELMQCGATAGRVFNIGNDEPVTMRGLAEKVVAYVDPTVTIEHLPYEKAYGAGFEDIRRRVPDLTRLREAIGFQARYGLDDILAEVITWKKASLDAGGSSLDSAPVRA